VGDAVRPAEDADRRVGSERAALLRRVAHARLGTIFMTIAAAVWAFWLLVFGLVVVGVWVLVAALLGH
jgi:hypothetical protein